MAQAYRERWQWELNQRKQSLKTNLSKSFQTGGMLEINHELLTDPDIEKPERIYVGQEFRKILYNSSSDSLKLVV